MASENALTGVLQWTGGVDLGCTQGRLTAMLQPLPPASIRSSQSQVDHLCGQSKLSAVCLPATFLGQCFSDLKSFLAPWAGPENIAQAYTREAWLSPLEASRKPHGLWIRAQARIQVASIHPKFLHFPWLFQWRQLFKFNRVTVIGREPHDLNLESMATTNKLWANGNGILIWRQGAEARIPNFLLNPWWEELCWFLHTS